MSKTHLVEIITSNTLDAQNALNGGAGRVELVSALTEGGLTPSDAMIRESLKIGIPTAVMVRPSSAGFTYRDDELAVIRQDLLRMEEIGVKHVVIGILDKDGMPDMKLLENLLEGTTYKVTFHRAIDSSADIMKALKMISQSDRITHVLTSGGNGKAVDHLDIISKMIDSTHLRIVVGSGVTRENIALIIDKLGDKEYDIHLGTDVRDDGVHGIVSANKVSEAVKTAQNK